MPFSLARNEKMLPKPLANIHCIQKSILFCYLKEKSKKEKHRSSQNEINSAFLASRKGLEPPTCCLGGNRSIQLSYRDVYIFIEISFKLGMRSSFRLVGGRSIRLSYEDVSLLSFYRKVRALSSVETQIRRTRFVNLF